MWDECIRCIANGEIRPSPAVDEYGMCGHCHWAFRAEVEEGVMALREYLAKWLLFTDWELSHGRQ